MSHSKQASKNKAYDIPWHFDPEADKAKYRGMGAELQKGLLYGGAAGLGIGGLYYLTKYLGDKYRAATEKPDPVALANAPITEVTAPEPEDESIFNDLPELPSIKMPALSSLSFAPAGGHKKAANFDSSFIYTPLLGAGAGALIGAARAPKGRRRQNAILGASLGGAAGLGTAAATSKPFGEYVARNLPKTLIPAWMWPGGSDIQSETSGQDAWRSVTNAVLPATAAAGGLTLVDAAARQDTDEKNLQAVEQARRDYFSALTGKEPPAAENKKEDNEKEKKSSTEYNLDALYDLYCEKKAEFEKEGRKSTIEDWYNSITTHDPNRSYQRWGYEVFLDPLARANQDAQALGKTLMLAGGLGAGAIGAKYMYDQTKARSAARNLQRAQAARRRMQGLDSPWVDPKELAEVKRMAGADNPAYTRGV